MSNRIVSKSLIKTIVKNGKNLKVEYATKTQAYNRTFLADSVKERFSDTVEKSDIPSNAATAILAEKEHASQSDSKDHFTTVFQDENGNHISTAHLYP